MPVKSACHVPGSSSSHGYATVLSQATTVTALSFWCSHTSTVDPGSAIPDTTFESASTLVLVSAVIVCVLVVVPSSTVTVSVACRSSWSGSNPIPKLPHSSVPNGLPGAESGPVPWSIVTVTEPLGAKSLPHMLFSAGSTAIEAADRRHNMVVALPFSSIRVAPPWLPGPMSTGFSSPGWSPGTEKSATQVFAASAIG